MSFTYDSNRISQKQVKHAYDAEISEYRREEERLVNLMADYSEEELGERKLEELRKKLIEIRLHINNLESEYTILSI